MPATCAVIHAVTEATSIPGWAAVAASRPIELSI